MSSCARAISFALTPWLATRKNPCFLHASFTCKQASNTASMSPERNAFRSMVGTWNSGGLREEILERGRRRLGLNLGSLECAYSSKTKADEDHLYQLNGVVHVVGGINEEACNVFTAFEDNRICLCIKGSYLIWKRASLYQLARLNNRWFWLNEPIVNVFIDRWRPNTHTFHMPFKECIITLQDVAYQLGFSVNGKIVKDGRVAWEWFQELFGKLLPLNKVKVLLADVNEHTVRICARACIMMLLSTQLLGDKSTNRIRIIMALFI
ncbi:hypothetical protein Ahy_A04g018506 [Arachis hypogaea]|uniref:Aminotransferase-like plant mobile domain-containing protein n=1 Tax=Arachis hypogaea TaxID=3818 RepID=A0A445DDU9_ARAHY|nr:hypothetical protein Ahy_A04g018506 [Arachis hypogaea]